MNAIPRDAIANGCQVGEMSEWWLDPIRPDSRGRAVAEAEAGNAIGFLACAANDYGLDLVFFNETNLNRLNIYEKALLSAFVDCRVNNRRWPLTELRSMFERGDRKRLRAAGDQVPQHSPFTVYRGVAGKGPARRIRGLSWTMSLDQAKWFAVRFHLENPTVYRTVVDADDVVAHVNHRGEQEAIVLLPEANSPKRILSAQDLESQHDEISAWWKAREEMQSIRLQNRAYSKNLAGKYVASS